MYLAIARLHLHTGSPDRLGAHSRAGVRGGRVDAWAWVLVLVFLCFLCLLVCTVLNVGAGTICGAGTCIYLAAYLYLPCEL